MKKLFFAVFLALQCFALQAASFDHSPWDGLLKKHVLTLRGGQATEVDYPGMRVDRPQLKQYLNQLSAVTRTEFDQWDKTVQLAFLINAYNAYTVELILTGDAKLESIKQLGSIFQSPWKKSFFQLLGKPSSLDDVEHVLIRASGRYQEPRIHFAVNCASIGCPALAAQAYSSERLEAQLESATQAFLSDRTRNRLSDTSLQLSSIFNWYRSDFEMGWRGTQSVNDFLLRYRKSLDLSDDAAAALLAKRMKIEYLDYDWRLNSVTVKK